MTFGRVKALVSLIFAVCALSACETYREPREPIVGYEEPGILSRMESDFVVEAVRNLDDWYYRPPALDYCALYNVALEGVKDELKRHGIRWGYRPVKDCYTNYTASDRFQMEFDRAWRIQGEVEGLKKHDLIFAATGKMLASLGRSHTYFIRPENIWDDEDEYDDGASFARTSTYTSGKIIHGKNHDWSYVRFQNFNKTAYSQFVDLYHDPGIFKMSVSGVILDLRGNPGGSHQTLKAMFSVFLRDGTEVFSTKGHKMNETFTVRGEPTTLLPLVVLIDEHSGSASEIFAGVVQETHRGVVIGKKSMGAIEVGNMIKMLHESRMMVTIAQIYTAEGRCFEGVGVEPDFEAERTEADIIEGKDPCIDKAKEVLEELQEK